MNLPTNNPFKLNQQVITSLHRKIGKNKIRSNSPEILLKQYIELENEKKITKTDVLNGLKEFCDITKEKENIFSNYISPHQKKNLIVENKLSTDKFLNVEDKNKVIENNKIKTELFFKTISPFNSSVASYESISYQFTNRKNLRVTEEIYKIINSAFGYMSTWISKPIYHITPKKIKIQLFFYWKPISKAYKKSFLFSRFLILNKRKLVALNEFLSKKFQKKVELHITRLFYPFYDSNILVNLIALIINFRKLGYIRKTILGRAKVKYTKRAMVSTKISNIPAFLSGIRIKIAGRIYSRNLKYKVRNRDISIGSLSRKKAALVNSARFTSKNKRGAYSITVKTGHVIIK